MQGCRKNNPIEAAFLEKSYFFGTGKIEKHNHKLQKKDINKEKIHWLHIKEIKIQQDKPYSIFVKNAHNAANYFEVNINKRQGRPPNSDNSIFLKNLEPLWPNGKSVA